MTLLDSYIDEVETTLGMIVPTFERTVAHFATASCHGCTEAACCRDKVYAPFWACLPLARQLRRDRRDTRAFREDLRARAEEMNCYDSSEWLNRYQPCVFLENERCTMYRLRPHICQNLWVFSSPEQCKPPAGKTLAIMQHEWSLELETYVAMRAMRDIFGLSFSPTRYFTVLPLSTWIALRLLDQTTMAGCRRVLRSIPWDEYGSKYVDEMGSEISELLQIRMNENLNIGHVRGIIDERCKD
jgi:Fe-S-cluster containining protein